MEPKRWLHFVELDPFSAAWKRLRLADDDLRSLQLAIIAAPDKGAVVAGTGGVRKIRFAPSDWSTGKSGAVRVYYAFFPGHGLVALIFAHDKSQMENIAPSEKSKLKAVVAEIDRYLKRSKGPPGIR